MVWYVFVFIAATVLAFGLILIQGAFFRFSLATVSLLDTMLDLQRTAEQKQRELMARLLRMLARFAVLLVLLLVAVAVALLPPYLYMRLGNLSLEDLDTRSLMFFGAMIAGSAVLFVPAWWQKKKDYSPWSMLLHRLILDNYHVSRALFRLDRFCFRRKLRQDRRDFVVVTGLARAGTTALTTMLHSSGGFHSLSYDHMPFLLAVNLWRKFHRPRSQSLRERAHQDRVKVGLQSVEALEEYFFKVWLGDSFIGDQFLTPHEIDDTTWRDYLQYQQLIGARNTATNYLAKNNNFLLRYHSLRARDQGFRVILLFRQPADHARSLLRQHVRFQALQQQDPFVLEYMNWLGHHEFGLDHKPFAFDGIENEALRMHSTSSVNYWLANWVHYYHHVLSMPEDPNLLLVDYAELLQSPGDLLKRLRSKCGVPPVELQPETFEPAQYEPAGADEQLLREANAVYDALRDRAL